VSVYEHVLPTTFQTQLLSLQLEMKNWNKCRW